MSRMNTLVEFLYFISGGRSQIKLYLEQVRIQNQSGNSHFGSLAHFGPYYSADDPFRMD